LQAVDAKGQHISGAADGPGQIKTRSTVTNSAMMQLQAVVQMLTPQYQLAASVHAHWAELMHLI